MASGVVFDDGVRFYDAIRVRMPSSLREQVKAAADREGLNPAEFARRALAERALRTTGDRRAAADVIDRTDDARVALDQMVRV